MIIYILAGTLLFIIYVVFDFFTTEGGISIATDKWLKKTLWIRLPFYAFFILLKEILHKKIR